MTTAPRLCALLPDVTVQRVRWSGRAVGVAGWLCCGHRRSSPEITVVKCRSSRRRSSAPRFQIAYSSESPRAVAEAAMMFVSEPIVDHSSAPSVDSMVTRVRAAVADARIDDAHLVVVQVDGVEHGVERAEGLAQRGVEGVDRAVALRRRVQRLAVDLDLDRRLGAQRARRPAARPGRCSRRPGTAARSPAWWRRISSSKDASAPSNDRPSLSRRLISVESTAGSIDAVELVPELLAPGSPCSPCRRARRRRAGPRCRRAVGSMCW